MPEQTIVRIRGDLFVASASAAGALFQGAFGIMIVTAAAAAAGIGSLPLPDTDSDNDGWMFHQFVNLTARAAADPAFVTRSFEIDSRAMRKFNGDYRLVTVWEATVLSTTSEIGGRFRVLSKLP